MTPEYCTWLTQPVTCSDSMNLIGNEFSAFLTVYLRVVLPEDGQVMSEICRDFDP
jgi:hypothetical protein